MPATIIHSATLVTDGATTAEGWVHFEGGVVRSVGSGTSWRDAAAAPDCEVVDASGAILSPGFIDIHVHGGGGAANEDGAEAIHRVLATHREHGTTRAVLSLVTGRPTDQLGHLATIAELTATTPGVLGSHLEGPFLADSHRGAHDPEMLRSPEPAETAAMLEAAAGTLRQITLAPELPGAGAAVRAFVEAGVAVAVGHTSATYEQAAAAFDAGASILTHTFNAMPGLHHRAPGPIAAAFEAPHVTLEVINDGVHVHPALVELVFRQAPGRVALITDAMVAACAHDGDYMLGSLPVRVDAGVARLVADGAIAGSTLTLDAALRQAVHACGVELSEALRALTATPARAIGRGHDLGSLRPGALADAVLLDDALHVKRVWVEGVTA
ncbi:N-acetylglucosamine 6-phosphate deacetylase [Leucobacter komagatae]|uniref:N-acetylglucosamine 6-phosphate deacetylase n=1 Tax=Leucobacter komagatae TaxID=55969 RepID=A0A542Y8Z5_9MICO|nr:N-acetylglucosamine-6-phosphate deacetylase [Leucobacter komagatae]TQL44464.1 N-acetylglucosamine 6-phosphate deacetylase [Leucobacter komagatae]